jgi:hypothetical protein
MTEQSPITVSDPSWRRRRRIGIGMIAAGGLLLLAGSWLGATALMARSQLTQVRAEARTLGAQLSASNWPAARATAEKIAVHAHRANQLASGPVWALAAALPSGGEPLKTIRGITAAADSLGRDALPELVSASQRLNPRTLRRPDGSIDLSRIEAVAPDVASAAASMDKTATAIKALPRRTWLGPVDAAGADALSQVTALNDSMKSANLAVRILPTMLGSNGAHTPRRTRPEAAGGPLRHVNEAADSTLCPRPGGERRDSKPVRTRSGCNQPRWVR